MLPDLKVGFLNQGLEENYHEELFIFISLLLGEDFGPETLLKTSNGYTLIEHIEIGQKIQSYNCNNNEITSHSITAKHTHTTKSYLVIKVENAVIEIDKYSMNFYNTINKLDTNQKIPQNLFKTLKKDVKHIKENIIKIYKIFVIASKRD